jgi:ParB-like chromosome segregation protein Spo0J
MKLYKITEIKPNPNNPRVIKDDKFKKLVKSLQDFPDMAKVRPIVVNTDMVVLGGNMRLKAMKEAGWKEVPGEVVDWPDDKQREFIIKDNVGFGEWDWEMLANEWDVEQLDDWGLDVPDFKQELDINDLSDEVKTDYRVEVVCKDEFDQEKIYNKLIELGLQCRLLTL